MKITDCIGCKWCYVRELNGFKDYFCAWRKNHRKDTNYDAMKWGRIVNLARIKHCECKETK